MKTVLYLLSGVLAAPGVLFALFLWMVTEVIKEGVRNNNLWKTFWTLLIRAVQLLDWGIWLVPIFLSLWLVLAFIPKYRIVGAAGASIVTIVSLVGMFALGGTIKQPGELFLPALSAAGLLINLWLIWNALALNGVKP